jgi:hypothetical protein
MVKHLVPVKYLKIAALVWGLVNVPIGYFLGFTLGRRDFWSGVTFLVALFVLPFPITVLALWRPKLAGGALLGCVAVSFAGLLAAVIPEGEFSLARLAKIIFFTLLYGLPHICFAIGYMLAAYRAERQHTVPIT